MAIFLPGAEHLAWDAPVVAARAFSRAARLSIAGLLLPSIALMLMSAAGRAVPGGIRTMLDWVPVLAFSVSGWLAATSLGIRRRGAGWFIGGFTAAGLAVVPAYGSLQGLTGRESVPVVIGFVGGLFITGFAVAAIAGARSLEGGPGSLKRFAVAGCVAGAAGAAFVLLPFVAAVTVPGAAGGYLRMPLAVTSTFGCLIVPYRMLGSAFGEAAAPLQPT